MILVFLGVSLPFLLLMPSYNQAHFIEEAVESCLVQDDPDWELWILDNSSDRTPEAMARFTDPRIHFLHEPRRMDPGTCLNVLLEQARGEHFSYIHTDNRLLPSYVRTHRAALSKHPLSLAVCDYHEIEEGGRRTKIRRRPEPYPPFRLFSVDTIGVPFAATTELAQRLGGFSSDDLADDVLFVLRADAVGPRVHIREPQMEYRTHGGSRFLQSGLERVQQAIHRSVLKAYSERGEAFPDPFEGGLERAARHVATCAAMAQVRARRLSRSAGLDQEPWILGRGPEAFWLLMGLNSLGLRSIGFLGTGRTTQCGLPVREDPPGGSVVLDPRAARGLRESLTWALRGLPPLDHGLKRLPGEVMSGLLVPFQAQCPGVERVSIHGPEPLRSYLAFGAESLAGLEVVESGEEAAWLLISDPGTSGIRWKLKGERGAKQGALASG